MKCRIYSRKQRKYVDPTYCFISTDGKRVIQPEIFFDQSSLGAFEPDDAIVEFGFTSSTGDGTIFYEGDVFSVEYLGTFYPYVLRLHEISGFYLKRMYNHDFLQKKLQTYCSEIERIGNIHKKDYKKRLDELNGK